MGKYSIMVVDDSRVTGLLIEGLLADTDYEIVAYCRNGEEAVKRYGEVMPDLVTMDIIMPGMDGLETAQAILTEYPEANIVMASSLAYDETFEEARSIGAKGFLDKPFDRETLIGVLDKIMGVSHDGPQGEAEPEAEENPEPEEDTEQEESTDT